MIQGCHTRYKTIKFHRYHRSAGAGYQLKMRIPLSPCNLISLLILILQYPSQTISSSHYGSSISIATDYSTIKQPATFISVRNKYKNGPAILASSTSTTIQKYDSIEDEEKLPSIEEMRASLGPIGRTIASAVEVGVVTAGSYLSGAVLGYTLGGFMAVPSLFQKNTSNKGPIANWHGKASSQAMNWASLSAAFSGFHALSRVVRNKEDKWNGIIGSAATGAFLSRKGGVQAMAQGGISYASVTYLLDFAFGVSGGKNVEKEIVDKSPEFEFTDAPFED